MASSLQKLGDFSHSSVPSGKGMQFGIVVSEWNHKITGALLKGAVESLHKYGVSDEDILIIRVPGAFELVSASTALLEKIPVDGIITLGCVIKGDTPHFDYICQGVTFGLAKLNTEYLQPVVFGVLTCDNEQQALDRAGGVHGNKGEEAAVTAIKMVAFHREMAKLAGE